MNDRQPSHPSPRAAGKGARSLKIAQWLPAALAAWCSTAAMAAPPSMPEYMDCARSMGVAISEQFVVLPGERFGGRGLYVYTDQGAYFVLLGPPHAEDRDSQEFFLRTHVSGLGDIYLNIRDSKPGGKSSGNPGISYQTSGAAGAYVHMPAYESLDDRAREVLSLMLKKRVAAIKDFIDDKNRYSTPEQARLAFERDRTLYLDRLEQCRMEGDRDLNAAIVGEVQKLQSGFPGVTVWEKQVQSRPAFAVPVVSSVR